MFIAFVMYYITGTNCAVDKQWIINAIALLTLIA